jgi:hypothetical protein
LFAQPNFGNPLNIPWQFSASFGELRNNAFHAGVDFRTQQREGLPIYAVADGTLSRVVVSATGYGKALYISHADGMMSVYAHLQSFIPSIEKIVMQQHYAKESFELDFQFPERLHFKKGDLIGHSGNTGSSGGPHLHFEIRNRGGEVVLHPGRFGYTVKDNIPPIISTFVIYPSWSGSLVNGQQTPLFIPVNCRGINCSITQDTIRVFGNFAFGIEATDRANDAPNILGLYSKQVFIDDDLKFAWRLDEIPFSHMRFINAFMDFAHFDSIGKRIQWTHILPGNRLNIYEKINNRGVFSFIENGTHNLRIEASDFAGNTSVLNVVLLADDEMKPVVSRASTTDDAMAEVLEATTTEKRLFSHIVSNTFETDEIRVVIPANTLYDNINFEYRVEHAGADVHVRTDENRQIFSNIHHVHNSGTPVHINYSLRIKPVGLPKNLENKATIGSWNKRKNEWVFEGGQINNGFILHNIRKFGIFAVCIDTIVPTIRPVDVTNNRIPASQNVLTFRIDDDFSGIGSYRATINGRWVLMEYDAKTKTLQGRIDRHNTRLQNGEHDFKLVVADKMNNVTTYQAKIIR